MIILSNNVSDMHYRANLRLYSFKRQCKGVITNNLRACLFVSLLVYFGLLNRDSFCRVSLVLTKWYRLALNSH